MSPALILCLSVFVWDGDSFRCRTAHEDIRVRIHALDCKELHHGGYPAKYALRNLLKMKPVTIQPTGQKTWGRTVAIVRARGRDVGCRLIASGVCARWPKYDTEGRYVRCQK